MIRQKLTKDGGGSLSKAGPAADGGRLRVTRWLMGLALLGVAARVFLWWISIGSNDTEIWSWHAGHILKLGLCETYRKYYAFPQYNHPPLMGFYAAEAWLRAGGDLWAFARLIKLPGLAGEAIAMWALWRYAGPKAFALYACLPAPILISSFHGNTDCLYAAFVLVAAIAFDRKRYFLSGLLWAASLNVKLLPLFLIPLVFLNAPDRKALLRLGAGFALGMTPFIPPALAAGGAMYRNMIAYNSRPENWGLLALLNLGASFPVIKTIFLPIREFWLIAGRYAILASACLIGLLGRRRGLSMIEQTAISTAAFFVLAPGFAIQYVVLAVPLLVMVDRRAAAWWGVSAGFFVGAVYASFITKWYPLTSMLMFFYPESTVPFGMVAWAGLAHFAWMRLSRAWATARP